MGHRLLVVALLGLARSGAVVGGVFIVVGNRDRVAGCRSARRRLLTWLVTSLARVVIDQKPLPSVAGRDVASAPNDDMCNGFHSPARELFDATAWNQSYEVRKYPGVAARGSTTTKASGETANCSRRRYGGSPTLTTRRKTSNELGGYHISAICARDSAVARCGCGTTATDRRAP